jgi:hypothetical protein
MFERLSPGARQVVTDAQQHARRLGHRYIGPEHLLLGLAGSGEPAGDVLRGCSVTPELVEEQIVRRAGLGAGAGLFGDLDTDALAVLGIDLDAVRARIEASFSDGALARAGQAVRRAIPPRRWFRFRLRQLRGRRARLAARPPRVTDASGRYQAPGPLPAGHLPLTPAARSGLMGAFRESLAGHDAPIGTEHLALSLITAASGMVAPILAAAGTSAPAVRAAILDRYRQAG